ncbi:MAG: hypothetical protein IKB52_02535 [Kiritimatiellae bacterium]|nr:hypothetical protein [Kiritimatiellia bacterium]
MPSVFENRAAFAPMAETVKWRQDKAPHLEGSFSATVLHGESQADSAGPSRGGFAADPWSVIVDANPAECVGLAIGDTLELQDGTVLSVQQITRDPALGWVIRCTSNARAPR